jgi:RNA polymerase sigma-70 factor, ECF subfamily
MYTQNFCFAFDWQVPIPARFCHFSDEALLAHYQQTGEARIVAWLIQRHQRPLAALLGRFWPDRELLAEQAQELYLQLCHRLRTVEVRTTFQQWLIWWTRNRLIDQCRRQTSQRKAYDTWAGHQPDPSSPQYEAELDRQVLIAEALDQLNDKERRCIQAFYLNEQSYDEIIEASGLSFNQVRNHLGRGRAKLRQHFGGFSGQGLA